MAQIFKLAVGTERDFKVIDVELISRNENQATCKSLDGAENFRTLATNLSTTETGAILEYRKAIINEVAEKSSAILRKSISLLEEFGAVFGLLSATVAYEVSQGRAAAVDFLKMSNQREKDLTSLYNEAERRIHEKGEALLRSMKPARAKKPAKRKGRR